MSVQKSPPELHTCRGYVAEVWDWSLRSGERGRKGIRGELRWEWEGRDKGWGWKRRKTYPSSVRMMLIRKSGPQPAIMRTAIGGTGKTSVLISQHTHGGYETVLTYDGEYNQEEEETEPHFVVLSVPVFLLRG